MAKKEEPKIVVEKVELPVNRNMIDKMFDKTVEEVAKDQAKKINPARLDRLKKFGTKINAHEDGILQISKAHSKALRLSTGILELDLALGGGWVCNGKMALIWGKQSQGKSEICYRSIAEAQQHCTYCIETLDECVCGEKEPILTNMIDIENSWDDDWAKSKGIDPDLVSFAQPDKLEDTVDYITESINQKLYGLHILDSIAMSTPEKELADGQSKWQQGLAARIQNKGWRAWTNALNRSARDGFPQLLIVINQEREKIGCFSYGEEILLADGSKERIGKIVNNKMSLLVKSLNNKTGEFENKKIIDWHDNGYGNDWLKIKVQGGSNGKRSLRKVTPDHMILTPKGDVRAGDLKVGDLVSVKCHEHYYNPDHEKLVIGSILGDGGLRFEKNGPKGKLRVFHGYKQEDYVKWKASVFGLSTIDYRKSVGFETKPSLEMVKFDCIDKRKGLRSIPDSIIDLIDAKILAIWYQDDGTFSGSHRYYGHGKCTIYAKLITKVYLDKVAEKIDSLGFGLAVVKEGVGLIFNGDESRKFQEAIAKFVHPSMRYKIKHDKEFFNWHVEETQPPRERVYGVKVIDIESKSELDKRYDITVEDNHNYLVNDILVHNCMFGDPSTKPGGKSQEFMPSIIVKTQSPEYKKFTNPISGGEETYLVDLKGVIEKNKTAPAKSKYAFSMYTRDYDGFNKGFVDERTFLLSCIEKCGWIKKVSPTKWVLNSDLIKTLGISEEITDKETGETVGDTGCKKDKELGLIFKTKGNMMNAVVDGKRYAKMRRMIVKAVVTGKVEVEMEKCDKTEEQIAQEHSQAGLS